MKRINLYTPDGWIDIEAVLSLGMPFNFIWSERGPGKTYGCIKHVLGHGEKHVLMRRTETEMNTIAIDDLSPYNPVHRDNSEDPRYGPVTIARIPKINAAAKVIINDATVGYTLAMATARNVRGFDLSDVNTVIYDEFIPEPHAPKIREEYNAFLNVIETVGRNREMLGKPPVTVICTANANNVANPIFMGMGVVNIAYNMQETGQEIYIDRSRGLLLFNSQRNEIYRNKKAQTALYKFAGANSNFSDMALSNKFSGFNGSRIKPRTLIEYKIIAKIGEISVYKHKSRPSYYISTKTVGTPKRVYNCGDADIKHGCSDHYYLVQAYLNDRVDCEDAASKVIFEKYFKLS